MKISRIEIPATAFILLGKIVVVVSEAKPKRLSLS
jgi:hypothetical protein